MPSTFETGQTRKTPFFMITRDAPRKWLAEPTWQSVQTSPADREQWLGTVRTVAGIFGPRARAPKRCPPLTDLDVALATAPTALLVNVDSIDFTGTQQRHYIRGPELFSSELPRADDPLEHFVEARAELEQFRVRRIVPVMRVTALKEPYVPGVNVTGTFTPGTAEFDFGLVDLTEKRVLCRSHGKATSSAVIEATTTTTYARDGAIDGVNTYADAHRDLADNIRKAVFAELATMSPAFQPTRAAKRL
jgi:hypothetical protein